MDTEELQRKFQKELNAGTVALVLLSLFERTGQARYGYEIAKELEAATPGSALVKPGALYPVLRNLAAAGLLASEVEPSVAGPPRRYYRITAKGREVLVIWRDAWAKTRDLVEAAIHEGSAP